MLRLHILGVGDGDCIVIELPDGRFGLIDSCLLPGSNTSPALPLLQNRPLAFCCLSHPHYDHFAGMLEVLRRAETGGAQFWYALHDVELVLRALSTVPTAIGSQSANRSVAEAKELYDLLDWVENQPATFPKAIHGIQNMPLGAGVELIAFGPRDEDWVRYRRAVDRQLQTGLPISRERANSISITIMVRYAGHLVWLLADLTKIPLRRLPSRAAESGIAIVQPGILASVLKAPHHGATNGWFDEMNHVFMRCQPDDVIVISAAGGIHHPNHNVMSYWQNTGKRIRTTYSAAPTPTQTLLPGVAGTLANSIARTSGNKMPCDVTVEIAANGLITVA